MISGADPDPDPHGTHSFGRPGSRSSLGIRIRIRIQEDQNKPQKWRKLSFEVLDVLFWGMKTSPVA
jgi:hypothetical protein